MLLYGDEVRRTQQGNNNAYCQDNETSWFNWEDVDNNRGLLRFVQQMTRFNRRHHALNLELFPDRVKSQTHAEAPSHETTEYITKHIKYHGVRLGQPDWGHYSHSIALHLSGDKESDDVYIAFNAYWEDLSFELPLRPSDKPWLRAVDTAQASPQDIAEPGLEQPVTQPTYLVRARSVVILVGHQT
jgi:glycogen operon protein